MSDAYWKKPITWNRQAEKAGRIDRVFCASMADVFEFHQDPAIDDRMNQERARLFTLIQETPNLMWLLLTKRPENVVPALYLVGEEYGYVLTNEECRLPDNVCIMTSVENQEQADKRIPELLTIPARYRGLSMEPLLDSVDIFNWLHCEWNGEAFVDATTQQIHWVIVGGESGPKARIMNPGWVESLRRTCYGNTSFFFKQWGEWAPAEGEIKRGDRLISDGSVKPGGKFPTAYTMRRMGKKAAGWLLDGREYNEHPFNLKADEVPA